MTHGQQRKKHDIVKHICFYFLSNNIVVRAHIIFLFFLVM